MWNIEKKNVGVIANEFIDEPLDGQRWGFNIFPKFDDAGVELDIIFNLLIPVDENKHILTKSGSKYYLHGVSKETFLNDIEPLLDLIQTSMEHTRRMFIQRNPEYSGIEVKHFDKNHFIEELFDQFRDRGLK